MVERIQRMSGEKWGGVGFALKSMWRPKVLRHGTNALGGLVIVGALTLAAGAAFDANDLLLGGKVASKVTVRSS